MTDKTIIEAIYKLFENHVRNGKPFYYEMQNSEIVPHSNFLAFIKKQLTLAEKRGEEKARIEFHTKKYSYQQSYRKRQTEAGNCRTCGKKAVVRGRCERHRKLDLLNGKNYRQRKKALKQSQEI